MQNPPEKHTLWPLHSSLGRASYLLANRLSVFLRFPSWLWSAIKKEHHCSGFEKLPGLLPSSRAMVKTASDVDAGILLSIVLFQWEGYGSRWGWQTHVTKQQVQNAIIIYRKKYWKMVRCHQQRFIIVAIDLHYHESITLLCSMEMLKCWKLDILCL